MIVQATMERLFWIASKCGGRCSGSHHCKDERGSAVVVVRYSVVVAGTSPDDNP